MADSSLKRKTVVGVAWSAVERFSAQGIQFVFNILIARILMPEDYGVVAMLGIFIAVAQAFIDSGFGSALVHKQDRTEDDFSTVFYFNLAVSVFFFAVLWLSAPAIASFYKTPLLTEVTRAISCTLIINAFRAIHETQLRIRLDFKTRGIITIICTAAIGVVGLWMAYKGYGVWALVAQSIVGSILRTVLMWAFVKWRPRFVFSVKSFKELFSFGSKILATGLFDTIYGNIYSILIGKIFNPASLGKYNRAESFATFPSSNLYSVIQAVSYPVLCSVQDDTERLRECFRKFVRMACYITFPAMIGLAAVADPFVRVVLTDKWADIIPLMQILCFSLVLYPISAFNITFPNVVGKPQLYLKMCVICKCVDIPLLLVTIPFGITAICLGRIAASVIGFVLVARQTRKFIGYGVVDQLKDISHIAAASILMGALVMLCVSLLHGILLKLLVGIAVGIFVYVLVSKLLRFEEYSFVRDLIVGKIKGTKKQ